MSSTDIVNRHLEGATPVFKDKLLLIASLAYISTYIANNKPDNINEDSVYFGILPTIIDEAYRDLIKHKFGRQRNGKIDDAEKINATKKNFAVIKQSIKDHSKTLIACLALKKSGYPLWMQMAAAVVHDVLGKIDVSGHSSFPTKGGGYGVMLYSVTFHIDNIQWQYRMTLSVNHQAKNPTDSKVKFDMPPQIVSIAYRDDKGELVYASDDEKNRLTKIHGNVMRFFAQLSQVLAVQHFSTPIVEPSNDPIDKTVGVGLTQ